MLAIRFIRDNPELVREAALKRGDAAPVDRLLEVDARFREVARAEEALNERSNQLGNLLKDPAQRTPALIEEGRRVRDQIRQLSGERAELELQRREFQLQVPNIPDP